MNIKKGCKTANQRGWKLSDQKALSADARIIASLKEKPPQDVDTICESAKIHKSTFYRDYHVLESSGLIKKVNGKYALWNYVESPSLWDRVQKKLGEAGGCLINLEVEKHEVSKPDPKTGPLEGEYVRVISIKGVMIFKGAKDLQTAASLSIPDRYYAFLFTQGSVDCKDRLRWQGKYYEVETIEEVFEKQDLSYRIAKLVTPFEPWAAGLKW